MADENGEQRFIRRMVERRRARGWSQLEAAKQLQLAGLRWRQQTLARVEQGERPLRLSEAQAIASFFGETIESMSAPKETTHWRLVVRQAAEALLIQELFHRCDATEEQYNAFVTSNPNYRNYYEELPQGIQRLRDWAREIPTVDARMLLQDLGGGLYDAAVEETRRIRVQSDYTISRRDDE